MLASEIGPQDDELRWLQLQRGVQLVLLATRDLGERGGIRSLFGGEGYLEDQYHASKKLLDFSSTSTPLVLRSLSALCEVTPGSSPSTNAYFTPLLLLTSDVQRQSREDVDNADEVFLYLGFVGFASNAYIALLKARDHIAMLLLCCWYKVVGKLDYWWIARRARHEWRVIAEYLEEFGSGQVRRCLALVEDLGN